MFYDLKTEVDINKISTKKKNLIVNFCLQFQSSLVQAIFIGDVEQVRILLKKKVDINYQVYYKC